MRRTPAPPGLSVGAFLTLACGLGEVAAPPGQERIVVQGVLNAQAAQQVLWIERTTPAGDTIDFGLRPLLEPPARVEVRDTLGTVVAFAPDSSPARFVAAFTVVPGRRYDLLVEAGGQLLRATTTVPRQITIVDPPGDTVTLGAELRLTWASGTSRHVALFLTGDPPEVGYFPAWVHDDTTVDVAEAMPFAGYYKPVTLAWVAAADSVTARVYEIRRGSGAPRFHEGNVLGGAGLFGSMTTDHVVVRVP